ncbi:hypothetical protein BJ878DRAFT_507701 [Calycina marina]|uniref:Uncharacterized protein n=1 Tax=Calycina marina TaxID=1763456 RepID=A0A9P8CEH0_9HELO|nr:hypothetical protein BJ878DRAFT_507701 [Calycina marina]
MSKRLSPALKALIGAPFARPNTLAAPPRIKAVYTQLKNEATSKEVAPSCWIALSTAATMTMNSAESLGILYNLATSETNNTNERVNTAEFMREIGLKCIGFNGVPRTINCLGAFREGLPQEIVAQLSTEPTRKPTRENIEDIIARGDGLWESIYHPFSSKLEAKLAQSHPDLPVHILNHEYGALFSDPPAAYPARVGRVLTSIVAVSCLRSQTGVGPQVTSHVFGLRKAFEDGSAEKEGKELSAPDGSGEKWLASDEGNVWLLESVDKIVECLGEGNGSSFAPGMSKL